MELHEQELFVQSAGITNGAEESRTKGLVHQTEKCLKEMEIVFTSALNRLRESSSISHKTVQQHETEYAKVAKYAKHLCSKMKHRSVANHVKSLLCFAKYVLREQGSHAKWEDVPAILQLRRLQAQLQVAMPIIFYKLNYCSYKSCTSTKRNHVIFSFFENIFFQAA